MNPFQTTFKIDSAINGLKAAKVFVYTEYNNVFNRRRARRPFSR